MSISLVYRSVLVSLMLTIVVFLAVTCINRESKSVNQKSQGISSDPSVNDKCNACSMDSFFVTPTFESNAEKILINEPVAIQFFTRVRLADKYDNEVSYDTLMKLFKMKHSGDRNLIYALRDQYFYFMNEIKPVLIENSIKIMDSIPNNRLLEFRGSNNSLFVNANEYRNQDGVLFFSPGKKLLFWTADREEMYCKDSHGLAVQYFLCSPKSNIAK